MISCPICFTTPWEGNSYPQYSCKCGRLYVGKRSKTSAIYWRFGRNTSTFSVLIFENGNLYRTFGEPVVYYEREKVIAEIILLNKIEAVMNS